MKTKVIFRIFKGEVLALFPGLASTIGQPAHCESYAHHGQHSGADYRSVIRASRPAMHCEFKDLHRELTRAGYDLEIVKRCTAAAKGDALAVHTEDAV